jgi:F-type H+-transporting ATPase subunit a
MPTTDSLTTAPNQAAEAPAKPNVFNEMFGFLGNHHSIDVMPIGKIPLPYFFWDQGSFHEFGSEEAVLQSGTYKVNDANEASPIAEKGGILRKDGGHVGLDLSMTSNMAFMLLASFILFIILRIAAMKAKKTLVPKGIRNLVEVLIVFVRDDIVAPNLNEPYSSILLPYFLTIFFFIMMINLVGLFPWAHTATGSLEVTAAFALCTFIITQIVGLHAMGIKHYLLHLTGGLLEMEVNPFMKGFLLLIMVPIEIMGLFTKPFALAIRLFANMTAGHIIILSLIGLTFLFHSVFVGALVTVPFSVFVFLLEIFVATLQAYIFTVLSAVFIGMMAHSEEEAHVQDSDMPHAPSGDHLIATSHAV